jgi:hypothetical protein
MNEVRVVQSIFCYHSQQIEVGDAALPPSTHLLFSHIEENSQVAVIATQLIDDLDHLSSPLGGGQIQHIAALAAVCIYEW